MNKNILQGRNIENSGVAKNLYTINAASISIKNTLKHPFDSTQYFLLYIYDSLK